MTTIEIRYGSGIYHLGTRTLDEAKVLVEAAAEADGGWLEVVDGGGPAHLFITRGVDIAFVIVPAASTD